MTLQELRSDVQRRLGDSSAAIWTSARIDEFIQDGADAVTIRTGCLWGMDVLPDVAAAFSITAEWEKEFLTGGMELSGIANFTAAFERDYMDDGIGPANHNHHWEFNDGHVDTTLCEGVADLPDDLYEIERSTWNNRRIDPLRSRELEMPDSSYELTAGDVTGYLQDKDGFSRLRKYRVPSAAYEPYGLDDPEEIWGVLVDVSDIDSATPEGTWGDFINLSGEESMGDPWGVVVAIYKAQRAVRIEYTRRAVDLANNQGFELPERHVVCVRNYAMARALECDGSGQELMLAAHFDARYEYGIARIMKQRSAVISNRKIVMGSRSTNGRTGPPLVRLPPEYGTPVRR